MSTEVKVPALGESISSGIIARWHVKDGDVVEKEQILYELETDKITSEGIAEVAGRISLKAKEGDEVKIGQVVAEIDESAADPRKDKSQQKKKAEPSDEKKEADDEPKEKEGADKSEEEDSGNSSSKESPESPPLSPAARRAAEETGVDPSSLEGSGKGGRVTKADILAAAEKPAEKEDEKLSESKGSSEPAPESRSDSERQTRRKLSPLRRRIAERLVTAQRDSAMLTTFNEVDMTAVKELRARHQEEFTKRHDVKLGFMSFFVKATVHALREVPATNAFVDGDSVVENHYFDIGVAVSTDKGLLVPVLRDCERKSFAELEKEISGFAARARDGKIKIEDLEGGVFTITNGGVFGSLLSTPILNPPQSAILGMHTIQDRPVARNGEIVIRPMMYLALSYDHRIVDGKQAVTFLVKIKQAIEDPARLVIGI